MTRTVEFRTYQLHPGTEAHFDELVQRYSLPLLRRAGMQVVWAGHSLHDTQAYLLVRAYADLAELESSQAHFYASAAWREGPREAVLACMASSTSVVLKLPQAALDAWLPNPAPRGTPDEHTQPAA
jgi:hypothetical protein